MRVNIVIDDQLLEQARKASGLANTNEVMELALKTLIRIKDQEEILRYRGKLRWGWDENDTVYRAERPERL